MNEDRTSSVSCATAIDTLQNLWAVGRLTDLELPTASSSSTALRTSGDEELQGTPQFRSPTDTEIAGHLNHCPSCRREAEEIGRLGQALETGLDRLGRAIGSTMDEGIETTLQRIVEEPPNAKFLRRIRRAIRLVLWLSLLGFTFIACLLLAVAVYKATMGL